MKEIKPSIPAELKLAAQAQRYSPDLHRKPSWNRKKAENRPPISKKKHLARVRANIVAHC
jgi:hypothetical protein